MWAHRSFLEQPHLNRKGVLPSSPGLLSGLPWEQGDYEFNPNGVAAS
ncbi:MAG: hypothetical protein QOE77_3864 [Blastocatellia bacterium]|jgi:hypothetical protein|nr:hypothetical protein [Blastocatellia bacterium]